MTFREKCAIAAMRELFAAQCRTGDLSVTADDIAHTAFVIADAMVAASGEKDVPVYGAAPSRTAQPGPYSGDRT